MTHRLPMGWVVRRFAAHLRPHLVRLVAFCSRRLGVLCAVMGVLALLGAAGGQGAGVPVTASSWSAPTASAVPDGLPAGTSVDSWGSGGDVVLSLPGSTTVERVLVNGGSALVWLCAGVVGLLVAPLLRSFADGDPFAPSNPRRLGGVAAAVLVATHIAPLLPPLAARLALDRLHIRPVVQPDWGPPLHASLLAVAVLLLLASALRQGRALQEDVAGLV